MPATDVITDLHRKLNKVNIGDPLDASIHVGDDALKLAADVISYYWDGQNQGCLFIYVTE